MSVDCHIHMVLDSLDWRAALARHAAGPRLDWIRARLADYRAKGFTYLRDGGDRWGVGKAAAAIAPEYGICYRTPLAPLCQRGHYGSFIGICYDTLTEYAALVVQTREAGGNFIKIMVSGLMDFDRYGVLTEEALPRERIGQLIHIAHEEGMSVMAHVNGADAVEAAAAAGVDSVEHGAYCNRAALCAMQEAGTVWVPTLSTIGNLRGRGRFCETAVQQILENAMERVSQFAAMGGLIAPGTDAGAWAVPHGAETEYTLLAQAGVSTQALEQGAAVIREKF